MATEWGEANPHSITAIRPVAMPSSPRGSANQSPGIGIGHFDQGFCLPCSILMVVLTFVPSWNGAGPASCPPIGGSAFFSPARPAGIHPSHIAVPRPSGFSTEGEEAVSREADPLSIRAVGRTRLQLTPLGESGGVPWAPRHERRSAAWPCPASSHLRSRLGIPPIRMRLASRALGHISLPRGYFLRFW